MADGSLCWAAAVAACVWASASVSCWTAAAYEADRRIAEIAGIQDDAKRATDLCAYLKNVTPT